MELDVLAWMHRRASGFLVFICNVTQMSKEQVAFQWAGNVCKSAVAILVQQEVQSGQYSGDESQYSILHVGHCRMS